MASKKSTDDRARTWSCVVYPESLPPDWREILDGYHIPWCESPLHDRDSNPGTGEAKKAHRHIALFFEGKKSYEQVRELTAPLNCPAPQRVHDTKGLVRYFAHLDNPEKAQYSVSDIIGHAGFDVQASLAPSASERYTYISEMITFCRENSIFEFQDLVEYALDERREDWFPLLCDSCAYIMKEYLNSRRNRKSPDKNGGKIEKN